MLLRRWSSLFYVHRAHMQGACPHTQDSQTSATASSQCLCNSFLDTLRTAQFWRHTQDSAPSDGWATAVPHSQLSFLGSGKRGAQPVPATVYFPVTQNSALSPEGTGTPEQAPLLGVQEQEKQDSDPTPSPVCTLTTPTPSPTSVILTTDRRRTCQRWGHSEKHPPSGCN